MVGGLGEATGGAAMTLYSGGAASVIGWPIFAHGSDHFLTGFQSVMTGKTYQTGTSQLLQKTGLSPQASNNIDISLSLGGTAIGAKCTAQIMKNAWQPRLQDIKNPTMNPHEIRFCQDDISRNFQNNMGSVEELANSLMKGTVKAEQIPPIKLFYSDSLLYSLDNRRLAAFKQANLPIQYEMATYKEVEKFWWKFTTENKGTSIRIRGMD